MADIKLTFLQKKVLLFFSKNSFGKNFYWTDGTLLSSHYLHHRDSVDLDFFSDNLFTDDEYLEFINALKKEIGAGKITLIKKYNRRLYLIKKRMRRLNWNWFIFRFLLLKRERFHRNFLFRLIR